MASRKCCAMVRAAVIGGFLPAANTLPCADCSKQAEVYDHRNYDYPLGVVAVCQRCNLKRGRATGTHDTEPRGFSWTNLTKKQNQENYL